LGVQFHAAPPGKKVRQTESSVLHTYYSSRISYLKNLKSLTEDLISGLSKPYFAAGKNIESLKPVLLLLLHQLPPLAPLHQQEHQLPWLGVSVVRRPLLLAAGHALNSAYLIIPSSITNCRCFDFFREA